MQPEALLFDLGGVIFDIDFERAFATWSNHSGVSRHALRDRFAFDEPYAQHERGELDQRAYFTHLRNRLGLELNEAAMLAGWNAIFGDPFPGITPLLNRLAEHVPVYAFSNSNAAHHRHWGPKFADTLRPFARVFVSHLIHQRKPHPNAFHHVARAVGVHPHRILFFDDTKENVEGARAVGMPAVHVRHHQDVRDHACAVLSRLELGVSSNGESPN